MTIKEMFTNDEVVHQLIRAEGDNRSYQHRQKGLKNANFPYKAIHEQLDCTYEVRKRFLKFLLR